MSNTVVLKLGGALITDKSQAQTLRPQVLATVAQEIRTCLDDGLIQRLVLLHGVGSFGHQPVLAHGLHRGFQSPDQLVPLSRTQSMVMHLRLAVAEALQQVDVPACTILPSSCMTAGSFAPRTQFLDAVDGFLAIGMVPLLGGDVLADDQVGFSVCSADRLAVDLALHLQADWLIFATDVDGVYTRDPAQDPAAVRLPRVRVGDLHPGGENGRNAPDTQGRADASGAMAGKLKTLGQAAPALERGMRARLLSMNAPGRLHALLSEEEGIGTEFVP